MEYGGGSPESRRSSIVRHASIGTTRLNTRKMRLANLIFLEEAKMETAHNWVNKVRPAKVPKPDGNVKSVKK